MSTKDTAAAVAAPEAVDVPAPVAPAADPVIDRLVELGLLPADAQALKSHVGLGEVDDIRFITAEDLNEISLTKIAQRKFLEKLTPTPTAEAATQSAITIASILPQVPDYGSLLDQLRAGGVLKVDRSTITGLVQAWVAERAGLFNITEKLAAAIKAYAERNDEPVDPTVYYRLKNQLTRTRYGDLFSAIEGFDGRNVTATAKKELLSKVGQQLWPAVSSFQTRLNGWHEAWVTSANNPLNFQNAVAAAIAGGKQGVAPSTGQAPDTGGLHDEADAVNDAANRVFAGEGVQIAAAVTFEAGKIRETLADPSLPAHIGAANHEQLLKQLGVSVSAADPRFERDLVQYVLSILQVKNLSGGQDELQYFDALWTLGNQIDWSQLGSSRRDNGDFARIGEAALRGSRL